MSPSYMADVEDRRLGVGGNIVSDDEFPASFPLARWNYQAQLYLERWNMFNGKWLSETMPDDVDEKGNPLLRYPLQINYLKRACMAHSYALFGEVRDTPGPLAPVRITPRKKPGKKSTEESDRTKAEELEDFINQVWTENQGRSLQQEAGLIQQPLGGIAFRLSWHPENPDLEYGIQVEYVLPDFFLPVWDTARPDDLLEVWIVYRIPTREAKYKFNISLKDGIKDPLYIEHWTRENVTITINNEPIKYTVNGIVFDFNNAPNPFGEIPFVYIPRERAGSYYGLGLLDDVIELARELNSRIADNSDVVEETSHRETYGRNIIGPVTPLDIGGTRPAVNIGSTPPGGETPDVFVLDPPKANEFSISHVDSLRKQLGRDLFIPGIAEGEDEGSQRSGLTLAFRMYPLTSKIHAVRSYWGAGLTLIAKKIARIAIIKGIGNITEDHLKGIKWEIDWASIIPRDREQDLNEVAIGIQSNIIPPKVGNKILGFTGDPSQTEQETIQWLETLATIESKASTTSTVTTPNKVNVKTTEQPVSTYLKEQGGGN